MTATHTTQTKQKRRKSILSAEFEPATPVIQQLKKCALDRTTTKNYLKYAIKNSGESLAALYRGLSNYQLPNLRFWLVITDDGSCPYLAIRDQWIKINIVT